MVGCGGDCCSDEFCGGGCVVNSRSSVKGGVRNTCLEPNKYKIGTKPEEYTLLDDKGKEQIKKFIRMAIKQGDKVWEDDLRNKLNMGCFANTQNMRGLPF